MWNKLSCLSNLLIYNDNWAPAMAKEKNLQIQLLRKWKKAVEYRSTYAFHPFRVRKLFSLCLMNFSLIWGRWRQIALFSYSMSVLLSISREGRVWLSYCQTFFSMEKHYSQKDSCEMQLGLLKKEKAERW